MQYINISIKEHSYFNVLKCPLKNGRDIIIKKQKLFKSMGVWVLIGALLTGCSGAATSDSPAETEGSEAVLEETEENAETEGTAETGEGEEETGDDESQSKASLDEYSVEEAAYESFTAFVDEFYIKSKNDDFGYFKQLNFWDQAEIYEIVIDAYEHTGDERYYRMIYQMFEGFKKLQGEDWSRNEYNDDIMWMTIACARAYNCTGDQAFLDIAKKHFDLVWDRAYSDDLGGGLFWRTDNQTKNACINCPAAIAASLLGDILDDESYYEKADQLMDWVVANIYEEDTGHVYDAYDMEGNINEWASTYNQGTFIGANTLLYLHTGDEEYFTRARRASDYTIDEMYQKGVMDNENNSGDLVGFKGILVRWMYLFSVNCDQPDIMEWVKLNALTAWSNRNSKGIVNTTWNTQTEEDTAYILPFAASTAVSALNNCRDDCETELIASQYIPAAKFSRCGKLVITEKNDEDLVLSALEDGAFLEYSYVNFEEESGKISLTIGADEKTTVEVRLGSVNGETIASAEVEGDPSEVTLDIEPVLGVNKVFLVFPNTGEGIRVSGFNF